MHSVDRSTPTSEVGWTRRGPQRSGTLLRFYVSAVPLCFVLSLRIQALPLLRCCSLYFFTFAKGRQQVDPDHTPEDRQSAPGLPHLRCAAACPRALKR